MRPPRYDRGPPISPYGSRRQDILLERSLADSGGSTATYTSDGRRDILAIGLAEGDDQWRDDPPLLREYVSLARAEGFRPTSVEQGRQVLLRCQGFLAERSSVPLEDAGWRGYAAYRAYLTQTGISRATVRCYLSYLTSFYRLRAHSSMDAGLLDDYARVKAIGLGRPASGRNWRALDPEVVRRLLNVALSEDHVFLMTLLLTGGPAQFYGLKVEDIDFENYEITTTVKGGKYAIIPLHPKLARI